MQEISIRKPKSTDAEAIIHTHYAAVQGIDSACYSPDIIEAWSPKPHEGRFQWMRDLIIKNEEIFIVAEDESGILGFGFIIPTSCELRALYIHPAVGRRGIGKIILQALETSAISQHILSLQLNASLNAQSFYQRNGYHILSHTTLRLSDTKEMNCVRMEKKLVEPFLRY